MSGASAFAHLCEILGNSLHSAHKFSHDDISWDTIVQQADRHRVQPLLLDNVQRKNIAVPEHTYTFLKTEQKSNVISGLKITRAAALAAQSFQSHGVDLCLFKGIALNHLMPGEFAFRHNGDLDILLVDKSEVVKADQLLAQLGFTRLGFSPVGQMTDYQIRLLQKYEKDLSYFSPDLGVKLELHLRLFVNDTILPLSNFDSFADSVQLEVANTSLSVMSLNHRRVYLLLHGATSIWFRLKWVCDIPAISNGGTYYESNEFKTTMRNQNVERIACQGLVLANRSLNMPVSPSMLAYHQSAQTSKVLVTYTEDHLQRQPPSQLNGFAKAKYWFIYVALYLPSLKPGLHYKLRSLSAYGTRKTDWEILQLPPSLGWAYLLFRPFFWLYRQFRSSNSKG